MTLFEQINSFKTEIIEVFNKSDLPIEVKTELLQSIVTQADLQIKTALLSQQEALKEKPKLKEVTETA